MLSGIAMASKASNIATKPISSEMAQVTMIDPKPTSSISEGDTIPAEDEACTFQNHAAVLNNVGSILFQRDNAFDAMRVYRESVQILIQATNNSECRLNKKRQEEMQDYLNYLMTSKEHLERVSQLEHSSKRYSGVNVAVLGSPELPSLAQHSSARAIAGLFQSTSRFKFAKHAGSHNPLVLSFHEPFSVAWKGRVESSEEKPKYVTSPCDLLEVSIEHVSEATLFNMGLIHAQWGSSDSALQYFQLALSVSSSQEATARGLRNPIVLASLSNVGQIFCQTGRIEEAMNVLSDATARCRAAMILLEAEQNGGSKKSQTKPRISPQTAFFNRTLARIMVNMANAQFCYCAYDDAKHTCEDALRSLRGQATSLDAAAIWFNMALIHEHQQHRLQALQYYKRFMKVACRIVGSDHPNIADALLRIGCVYFDMGQLQKALHPLLRALGIRAKFETEHHFSMAEIYHQIGKVLQAREEFDDALRALSKALEIQRKTSLECTEGSFCEVCLALSETLLNLGRLHHGRGDFAESLKAHREVLDVSLRIFGRNHLQTARLYVIIANLELELDQVPEAMSNFEKAIRIESVNFVDDSIEKTTTVKVKNPLVRVVFSHCPCAPFA